MDIGCSSWESRLVLPQWSNDPWSSSNPNPGPIISNILDPIVEEGFIDSDTADLLINPSSSIPQNTTMTQLPEPAFMPMGGSGSKSGSLDCMLSGSTSKTDPTSVEDDGISLIFSDNTQTAATKRNTNSGFKPTGPCKRVRRGEPVSGVNISFRQGSGSEPDAEAIQQMKEMIYRAAAFRPVSFTAEETAEKPKRRNVRISSDPQTVAARQRRERISEKLRVLQKLVPGGSKMDTASMLEEAANYLKFLRNQVKALETFGSNNNSKVDLLSPCVSGNFHLCPPINLQFSSLPLIPMQDYVTSTSFSFQNPTHHVHLPQC